MNHEGHPSHSVRAAFTSGEDDMSYKRNRAGTEEPGQGSPGVARSGDGMRRGPGPVVGRASDLLAPQLVVFACTDDVGGSQIAAAWFSALSDPFRARAVLVGVHGIPRIPPDVVVALKEMGHDPKGVYARSLTPELLAAADLVVTMGDTFDRGILGTIPPVRREHWLIPDPVGTASLARARSLRDLIRSRVAMLVFTEGWGRADISRELASVTRTRWSSHASA
jgi:arsenate reductase (thioredoxin)